MLCDVCKSINVFSREAKNPHHANLHAVYQAAEQGCELCQELRVEAERELRAEAESGFDFPFELNMDSQIIYRIYSAFTTSAKRSVEFSPKIDSREHLPAFAKLEIYVEHDCAPELAGLVEGRPSFATPHSDGCFSLINTWMRECAESHGGYCPSGTEAPLPTRVLDIGIGGGGGSIFLKVANQREVGAYVTLSHCWGPEPHFRTILSNIADFEQSISLEELPRTFQDAILVARRLGFRFLWIDSLCIIQDSHEDWVQEAASMHIYYKRSALTIAVDCARGDHEGFLHLARKNDPPLAILPSVGLPLEQVSGTRLGSTQSISVVQSPIGDILLRRFRERDEDHLSERGWTLQETLLSPGTIHYSATKLKWNCQNRSCSERNLSDYPAYHHPKQGFLSLSEFLSINKKNLETDYRDAFQLWYKILDDYAFRALSVSSDKLPAISGLAHEFSSQIHSTYKAGIWLENMHFGLTWSYSEHGIKPDSYRAPSWSWAAMDCFRTGNSFSMYRYCYATSFGPKTICKAEVLNCVVTLKDNDPYGAVLGGELTLRTFSINLDKMWNLPPPFASGDLFSADLGCIFDEIAKGPTYSTHDYYLDVSLVRIRRDDRRHLALLLKPAKGERNEGKFVRVGIARLPRDLDDTQLERGGWVKRDVTII